MIGERYKGLPPLLTRDTGGLLVRPYVWRGLLCTQGMSKVGGVL